MLIGSILIIAALVKSKDGEAKGATGEGSEKSRREKGVLPIYDMPGHLIRRLHQISVSIFLEEVGKAGFDLTQVQFAALVAIRACPGFDQARIAGLIAYDRVTIGGAIEHLVRKGYVRREINPRDRRARALYLTEEGEAALMRLVPVVRDLQRDILAGLDATEQALFLALLKKATAAGNARSRAPLVLPESAPPRAPHGAEEKQGRE